MSGRSLSSLAYGLPMLPHAIILSLGRQVFPVGTIGRRLGTELREQRAASSPNPLTTYRGSHAVPAQRIALDTLLYRIELDRGTLVKPILAGEAVSEALFEGSRGQRLRCEVAEGCAGAVCRSVILPRWGPRWMAPSGRKGSRNAKRRESGTCPRGRSGMTSAAPAKEPSMAGSSPRALSNSAWPRPSLTGGRPRSQFLGNSARPEGERHAM